MPKRKATPSGGGEDPIVKQKKVKKKRGKGKAVKMEKKRDAVQPSVGVTVDFDDDDDDVVADTQPKSELEIEIAKIPSLNAAGLPEGFRVRAADIKNKSKRQEVFGKQKRAKALMKRQRRERKKKIREKFGEEALPREVPRTLENTREDDETFVEIEDAEALEDESNDPFSDYFKLGKTPKLLFTTSQSPNKNVRRFINDMLLVFPNSEFYKRRHYQIKEIVQYAINRDYTYVVVVSREGLADPNAMWFIHLPYGPTCQMKLTNITLHKRISRHANPTPHHPEIILNNFNTRLGHTIGRMFASLTPQEPHFEGRRVVTFHNQRDFIFFRHHRYIFESDKKARLQEIGPRFTLQLMSVQKGTFDTKFGEYVWIRKKDMETSRRRFFV